MCLLLLLLLLLARLLLRLLLVLLLVHCLCIASDSLEELEINICIAGCISNFGIGPAPQIGKPPEHAEALPSAGKDVHVATLPRTPPRPVVTGIAGDDVSAVLRTSPGHVATGIAGNDVSALR